MTLKNVTTHIVLPPISQYGKYKSIDISLFNKVSIKSAVVLQSFQYMFNLDYITLINICYGSCHFDDLCVSVGREPKFYHWLIQK